MKITSELLRERQEKPLKWKIQASLQRIEEWYDYHKGQVYVSFSGGKDSTVLLHLVRSIFPDVPAVFCNTGLEYPEIVDFVKSTDNVKIIRPGKSFRKVIQDHGYPVISKEQAYFIYQLRTTKSEKLRNLRLNGNSAGFGKLSEKWKYLIDSPFKISDQCCDWMKKKPFKKLEKETGLKPFIGVMAENSQLRKSNYIRYGCNEFDEGRSKSKPLSFWMESDVWNYLKQEHVKYCSVYDMGYERTGCMFCMFGVHMEDSPNRFQMMQNTHPKQYKYCIEKLGIGPVLDYMGVDYSDYQLNLFEIIEQQKANRFSDGAYITHKVRRDRTEKAILQAQIDLQADNKRVTKAAVARIIGQSRVNVSKNYSHLFRSIA